MSWISPSPYLSSTRQTPDLNVYPPGMWVARLARNRICLAKRHDKQVLRRLWLERRAKLGRGVSSRKPKEFGLLAFGGEPLFVQNATLLKARDQELVEKAEMGNTAKEAQVTAVESDPIAAVLEGLAETERRSRDHRYAYSEYPVSFHGHRATALNSGLVVRNTGEKGTADRGHVKKKQKNFSLELVHEIVRGDGRCPWELCEGYEVKVWKVPAEGT